MIILSVFACMVGIAIIVLWFKGVWIAMNDEEYKDAIAEDKMHFKCIWLAVGIALFVFGFFTLYGEVLC